MAEGLGDGQLICRYHRAEYAVLCPGVNSIESAREQTQALLDRFSRPVSIGGGHVSVRTSAGAALSDSGYASVTDWLRDAHEALTEARELGHSSMVVHDESTRNRVDVRITPTRVIKGWEQEEFQLMYQPIVGTADGRIAGFEALLRWRDPGASGTFIGPGQFLHLLERTGLSPAVGAWVVKEACGQVKSWNDQFPDRDPLFVTVNLAARQIAQADFPETVVRALDAEGLSPELLVLDLTEEALRFNKAGAWNALRDLKYLGVRLGLDDFGVGESGMSYLRDLSVDFLTIHRSFMQGVGHTEEDAAVIRAIVDLSHELSIATIAEGVEFHEHNDLMKRIEPDYLQGYFYGHPELAENTETILRAGPTIEGAEDKESWDSVVAPPADPAPSG
jgi:EAL domain-containing protein (putative c-di-GMP-specific phosphodiesterase class I)